MVCRRKAGAGDLTITGDTTIEAQFTSHNAPPEITSTAPPLDSPSYLYYVRATDPDGDPLTFSLLTAPTGMTLHPATGRLFWDPAPGQVGFHPVSLKVSDGQGGEALHPPFTLQVSSALFDEEEPVVTLTLDQEQILLGGTVTMTLSATDNIGVTEAGIRVGSQQVLDSQGSYTYTATTAGAHRVYGSARDAAWNEAVVTKMFWVRGPTATIAFHEGFDAERGAIDQDPQVLTMLPRHMQAANEITLPGTAANPFNFGAGTDFHVQYHNNALILVPESTVSAVLLQNQAYDTVTAADIANLTVWTAGKAVSVNDTVIFKTGDTHYFKLGNLQQDETQWTVTFHYQELQPNP